MTICEIKEVDKVDKVRDAVKEDVNDIDEVNVVNEVNEVNEINNIEVAGRGQNIYKRSGLYGGKFTSYIDEQLSPNNFHRVTFS